MPERGPLLGQALRFASQAIGIAAEAERKERIRRAYRAAGVVLLVVTYGTVGYRFLTSGTYSWLESLYMTMLTLSTIGFEEVIPVKDSRVMMAFTLSVMCLGIGSLVYFLSSLTAMVVEGDLLYRLWRRRMMRSIDELEDHVVVAGAGRSGIHAVRELRQAGTPIVVVERDADRMEHLLAEFGEDLPHLVGDALEDAMLITAGIERARGLIATLHEDRDNLFLCLSARQLKPALRIVSKVDEAASAAKFRRVGVDSVVSPARMGGDRIAHEMIQPGVTSFIDTLLGPHGEILVLELEVSQGSAVAGQSIRDSALGTRTHCLVLGIRDHGEEHYRFNPPAGVVLQPGSTLMALGDAEQLGLLRGLLTSEAAAR